MSKWRVGWWEQSDNGKVTNHGTSDELSQEEAEAAVRGIRATDKGRHAIAMEVSDQDEDARRRKGRR